jgi:transposase-like protein
MKKDTKALFAGLYHKHSTSQIAKILGIARSTAFKWRDQLSLPKRAWGRKS